MTFYTAIRADISKIIATTESGSSVTRTPVTKTISNTYGTETLTDGTPETISIYIEKKNTKWEFDKEGEVEGGDALAIVAYNQTLNKNDKITYNSDIFRVKNVKEVLQAGTVVYKKANLFLVT